MTNFRPGGDVLGSTMGERYCYLSTGAKATFYTLRMVVSGAGFFKDNYIKRLYTDEDRSIDAAKDYSERTGLQFRGVFDEPCYKMGGYQKAIKDRREQEWVADLNEGIMPWGKYKGVTLDETPGGYVAFIITKLPEMDFFSDEFREVMTEKLQVYADAHKAWLDGKKLEWAEKASLSDYVGEVKKRVRGLKVEVETVKRNLEGVYGYYDLITFRTEEGSKLVYMGGSGPNVAEKKSYVIDFTPKAHEEWKGEKQTKISRVKVLREAV